MRSASFLAAAALIGICGATANAQDAEKAETAAQEPTKSMLTYPAFKYPRYLEDWSDFQGTDGGEFVDPYKHVDLNDDGSVWASFGGSVRLRGEYWQNFGWSDATTADDTFALFRVLAHSDIHFGENYRAFIQAKSALATDRDLPGGRRTLDVDTLAIQQAFGDAIVPLSDDGDKITFRVGRQALKYGKQRLVSPLPWANTMRTWDAALASFEFADWKIDGFVSRYVAVQKYEVNDWQPGPTFYGVYANTNFGADTQKFDLDLYWLGLDKASSTFNGTTGSENRQTLGARIDGLMWEDGMDFDSELSVQFGDVGTADVSAWAFAFETGYTWKNMESKPRVYGGFDYATGDKTAGDGNVETFNQLFPLGHAYLGYMDFVGRQNIMALNVGALCKPTDKWTFKADAHLFQRVEAEDALYNAGGGVVRPGAAGSSKQVGQEIDLTAIYKLSRHTVVQGGYSVFFNGDFIKETTPGGGNNMHWFYLQSVYRF